jgi:hypothetical protein
MALDFLLAVKGLMGRQEEAYSAACFAIEGSFPKSAG